MKSEKEIKVRRAELMDTLLHPTRRNVNTTWDWYYSPPIVDDQELKAMIRILDWALQEKA